MHKIKLILLTKIFFLTITVSSQTYQWQLFETQVKANLKQIFVVDSLNIWIGGDSAYILYSSNKGSSWIIQNYNPAYEITDIFFLNKNQGWAIENGSDGINVFNNILFTNDGGENWIRKRFRPDNVTLYTICFLDSMNGFVGGDQNIFHFTTNAGEDWYPVQRDTAIFSQFPVRKIRFISNTYGFAVGGYFDFGGVLWHSTNNGFNWMTDSAYADPFFDLEFIDSTTIITIASDIERSYPSAVFKSTNLGTTWNFFEIPYYGVSRGISKRTKNEIWGTFQNEFIYSIDKGDNWITIPTPSGIIVYDIEFIDSTFGISVADSGYIIFYRLLPDFVESDFSFDEKDFHLYQNFPNPFNSSTYINFTISSETSDFVTLKIYDLLGREITTLVADDMKSGNYQIQFITDDLRLSSGIYFFQLQVGKKSKTLPMILLR